MTEETTEWCMSLPLVQRRKLDAQERQLLQRQLRLLRWRVPGILLSFAAIYGGIYAIAQAVSSTEQDRQIAVTLGYVVFYFVFAPAMLLLLYDVFRRRKAWWSELNAQEVKRFAGIFQPEPGAKALLQTLRHSRFTPDKATGMWSIETLGPCGRLCRVQDHPVKVWKNMPFVRVAQTPEVAAIAAQWLQPVQHDGEENLYGQREMSPCEQEELRRFARRLCLRFLPLTLAYTLLVCVLAGLNVAHFPMPDQAARVCLILLACGSVDLYITAAKVLQASRRMYLDAQAARIAIIRVDAKTIAETNKAEQMGARQRRLHNMKYSSIKKNTAKIKETAGAGQEDIAAEEIAVEVLPFTQRRWTEAGHPSAWRVASSAA